MRYKENIFVELIYPKFLQRLISLEEEKSYFVTKRKYTTHRTAYVRMYVGMFKRRYLHSMNVNYA